ncbi:hypothetical protein [Pedobacter sp. SL55]|uniref:hypothetical protein n=1 Tax=Pedobacter sp. SL55 TaxID=2995161 RepID=UPI00226DF8DA|nr:hypothetical protein [Pedobacter sp. SL55]WAC40326.1 hypothetical protein OVA16_17395 [Pedobacter sp. SL55]
MVKTEHRDKALNFYKADDWVAKYGGEEWFSSFHHPQFLNVHALVYKVKPVYFTYVIKGKIVFAISSFEKGNKLIVPDHFLRTGFWINLAFNEIQILTFLQEMLKELKAIYKNIRFNLPVEITDVRPFVWSGFKFKLMHTYEKKLNTRNYHTNIARMLKKKDPGFTFTCLDRDFTHILDIHRRDFYRFGVRRKHVALYLPLLQKLRNEGFLIDLNLKFENEIVASNLVLLNKMQKKAYIVLIARSQQWYEFGAHAKIYDKSFEYLKNEGYEVADLFGADVPGFALFKLKFDVELKLLSSILQC